MRLIDKGDRARNIYLFSQPSPFIAILVEK
jgi:hypothetical protein